MNPLQWSEERNKKEKKKKNAAELNSSTLMTYKFQRRPTSMSRLNMTGKTRSSLGFLAFLIKITRWMT